MIADGATKKEVSDEVSSIADEFNVDPKFLKKIADSIRKDVEGELENKLKPIEEMNKAEKFDKAFTKDVNEVLADMPDFKDIVNKDVIKSLTLKYLSDSSKKNMTLREIIEETYAGSLRGKRTIETTTPRGGKEPEDIDTVRMKKDPTYLAEVLANPTLKAKYNKEMLKRVENYL
jgi:phosphoglucomutase